MYQHKWHSVKNLLTHSPTVSSQLRCLPVNTAKNTETSHGSKLTAFKQQMLPVMWQHFHVPATLLCFFITPHLSPDLNAVD